MALIFLIRNLQIPRLVQIILIPFKLNSKHDLKIFIALFLM